VEFLMTDATMTAAEQQRLEQLEAEARDAHERFDAYREEIAASATTSPTKLRKLQEATRYAEARLERARRSA
jgi:hypothetical protein